MAQFDAACLQELKMRHDLVALVGKIVPLRRMGSTFRGPCPWCGGSDRASKFSVLPAAQKWNCHECGRGSDVIGFLQEYEGLTFPEAIEELGGVVELSPADRKKLAKKAESEKKKDAKRNAEKLIKARGIWDATLDGEGSLVDAYLRYRGIPMDKMPYGWPKALRFHPSLDYWHVPKAAAPVKIHTGPAMIAAIVGIDGAFMGVHCTWIEEQGRGKKKLLDPRGVILNAKKIQGFQWGGAIRLTPRHPQMISGEGIETTLSGLYGLTFGKNGPYSAWCGISLNNMSGGAVGVSTTHPKDAKKRVPPVTPDPDRPGMILPDWAERVTWLGDGDSDPYITAARLSCASARCKANDVRAMIAWADRGKDFNDMLRALR